MLKILQLQRYSLSSEHMHYTDICVQTFFYFLFLDNSPWQILIDFVYTGTLTVVIISLAVRCETGKKKEHIKTLLSCNDDHVNCCI